MRKHHATAHTGSKVLSSFEWSESFFRILFAFWDFRSLNNQMFPSLYGFKSAKCTTKFGEVGWVCSSALFELKWWTALRKWFLYDKDIVGWSESLNNVSFPVKPLCITYTYCQFLKQMQAFHLWWIFFPACSLYFSSLLRRLSYFPCFVWTM